MSKVWWTNISAAIAGKVTAQKAMDNLANQQDRIMASLKMKAYSPVLNKEIRAEEWLWNHPPDVSPKRYRNREKPETMQYEKLLKRWKE